MSEETPAAPTCSTCLYWGTRQDYWNTYVHRTCDAPQMRYGKALLQDAMAEPTTAVVETWEGWGILVGPDFGCVHHVPNPNPTAAHPAMAMQSAPGAPSPAPAPAEGTGDATPPRQA
jgi:hypothetical protein